MDNQKFQNLLQDEKFTEVMGGAKTTEEVQKVFKENGVDVSTEEVDELVEKGNKVLDNSALENVVGGNKEKRDQLIKEGRKKLVEAIMEGVNEGKDPDEQIDYATAEKYLKGCSIGLAVVAAGGLMAAGAGIKTLVDRFRRRHS